MAEKTKHNAVISCKNVWKVYDPNTPAEVRALQDINVSIDKGEFVSIMGVSGSGKSTLLHCIGCLDTPTKGKVYIDGVDISKLDEGELALIRRRKIGFVFQFFNIIPSLTALQNVELPMIFAGGTESSRRRKAKALLEKVGLSKRLDHKPSELSGGETQRVAIARSLANDPAVVLADEPTGNLDSRTGKDILSVFNKLNKEGKTIVVVTHDPMIAGLAKRIIKIKDGKIVDG